MNKQHEVYEFMYNGFSGNKNKDIIMPYTAEFDQWTEDPGIASWYCSDKKYRLIPTFAIKDLDVTSLPQQPKTGVLFGVPCKS